MQNSSSQTVGFGSTKLLKALEYMTIITCIVMSDAIMRGQDRFLEEDDEILFEELH